MPPRLPPRSQSKSLEAQNELPPYSPSVDSDTTRLSPNASASHLPNHPYQNTIGDGDPRSSSTQSLRPIESAGSRRVLLLVYIHGFMGTETSFKSFPAHVHSLLTITLAESHIVHTKIYPRYRSRKNISIARDAFSNWLYPHESENTDVILIGHSLGGILGAEVCLLPNHAHGSGMQLQHRILGLIAFDTPFLGMHPGVIGTGIASLFRGDPEPQEAIAEELSPSLSQSSSFLDISPTDPNYNPAFQNDVHLPVRKNKWERAWYFWNKHGGDLRKATQSYVKSHLEFGGCMADYPGLRRRYDAIRALEDVDELAGRRDSEGHLLKRVRFVNYYSASTGRIKPEPPAAKDEYLAPEIELQTVENTSRSSSRSITPQISVDEHKEDGNIQHKVENLALDDSETEKEMTIIDPIQEPPSPTGESSHQIAITDEHDSIAATDENPSIRPTQDDDLPPLPPEPQEPAEFDSTKFSNPDAVKVAQDDHNRQIKLYQQAKKEHGKAVKQREKIISKRKKTVLKEQEKAAKFAKEEEQRLKKEESKRQSTLNPESHDKQMRDDASEFKQSIQPKKDRKFCALPAKNAQTGKRDETWIRVYMEGVDEVVAHTTLFNLSETYSKLVGDTAERIEDWLREDATTNILLQEQRYEARR